MNFKFSAVAFVFVVFAVLPAARVCNKIMTAVSYYTLVEAAMTFMLLNMNRGEAPHL